MTFEKIFQKTVLCQNTGKGTEVFVCICFSKKLIWRIPQIPPEETAVYVSGCNLFIENHKSDHYLNS